MRFDDRIAVEIEVVGSHGEMLTRDSSRYDRGSSAQYTADVSHRIC